MPPLDDQDGPPPSARGELAAYEARALLAAIVSDSDDAIVSKSLDGIIRSWNAAAERLFGYAADEAIGRPLTLIIPPERRHEEDEILAKLRGGERIDHFETVRIAKDGRRIHVSVTISPIRDEAGRIIGASKVARDISQQKRAEALARDREERHEFVLAAAGAAIWDWDVTNNSVVYSARWKELRGFAEDEIDDSLDVWMKGIHPDDVDRVMAAVHAHFDGRTEIFEEEYRVRHKDGHWIWLWDRGLAKRNDAGEVVRMAGSETDITEKKRAEAVLRETEAQYRELVETANSAIIRWRCDGTISFANDFAESLFGYPDGALVGRDVRVLLPDQDSSGTDLTTLVNAIVARPARYRHNVNENVARDGRRLWMLWTNRPVLDRRGRVAEILAVGSDITKLKRAEDALREADRRKNEFLAVLGHELRNPLAPLSTGLELLERAGDDQELADQVRKMMSRQLTHLVRLVDDLVDVSRISRGTIELRRQRLDLREVVSAAVELTKPTLTERGHTLTLSKGEQALLVEGDFERLTQVLANILGNAAKYTPPGGKIAVATETAGGHVVVRVADNGLGIPSQRLDKLFDMFSRVPEHRTHDSGTGLGIGLALSRQLLELHGGTVEARSKGLGHGSEFIVRLPGIGPGLKPQIRSARADAPAEAPPRRILLVDDNVDAADSLRTLLRLGGHQVEAANDGETALRAFERFAPDVVLLDIGLPHLDGYEVARRIRAHPDGARVLLIAVTGWGQEQDRRLSKEAGFDKHLTKPVDAATLTRLIGRSRSRR